MGIQVLGNGFHQQVVVLRVDINNAGIHHHADADLAAPQHAVRVGGEEIPLEDIDGSVYIIHIRSLLAAGELTLADLFNMVVHSFDHIEPGIAAGFAHAEHQIQIIAALFFGEGVFDVRFGAQGAGDVQVHVPVIRLAGAFLHAVQTVLIDSHLRHAVAAQFLAARQEDDFRVLGGNQFGQLRAVGV